MVTRVEEQNDAKAERFALKVPEYRATAAQRISEVEFLKVFREEARALLAIPEHPNLARFVTFDAGAKPKPILVMELVEGVSFEKLIASKKLMKMDPVPLLDGILAGLEAMHAVRVGHLDIKPSNVILREGKQPVLVDFGLAGRRIRSGCASGPYGAPEIWGVVPEGAKESPMAADIYSFGCLAYEMLTGETLFNGPTEIAIISAHLTHDGTPARVHKLSKEPGRKPFTNLLFHCLRHNPNHRMTATALRAELKKITASR
jgi:serine/threonine protein kinase